MQESSLPKNKNRKNNSFFLCNMRFCMPVSITIAITIASIRPWDCSPGELHVSFFFVFDSSTKAVLFSGGV